MDNNTDSKFELLNNTLDILEIQCIKEIIYALHLGNSFRLNEHRQVYFDKILLLEETDETVISNIVGNNILDNEKLENIKIIKVKDVTSDKIYKCGNKESIFLFLTECRIYNGGESTTKIESGSCYICKNIEFAILEPEKVLFIIAERSYDKGKEKEIVEEKKNSELSRTREEEVSLNIRKTLRQLSDIVKNDDFRNSIHELLEEELDECTMLIEFLSIVDNFLGRDSEYYRLRNAVLELSESFHNIIGTQIVKTLSLIKEIRVNPLYQMIENINKSLEEQALKDPYANYYEYLLPTSIVESKIVEDIINYYEGIGGGIMTYKRIQDTESCTASFILTYTP